MSIVFVMAPIALLLAAVFVAAFIWASRDGQFDDTQTPAHRVLLDDPDRQEKAADEPTARKNRSRDERRG